MEITTRVSFLLLIVVLATATLAGTQGHATLNSKPVASNYVTTKLYEDEASRMYFDLSALPLTKRKAVFRNASPADKSNLWRTHLMLFLAKHPDLDEPQKEIVLNAISLASPEHFEVLTGERRWKAKVRDPLRVLEGRIMSAFSFEDAVKIFATLGDDTEVARRAVLESSVLLKTIKQDIPVEGPACSCSTESDWCPMSGYCSGGGCTGTQSGCGTLWTYPCNGGCR